uniref:pleckstrin homology domain-containing family A member 3-like n=1 Tax=Myxine glutinosa TaxID=7769 RepID=UPI00358F2C70
MTFHDVTTFCCIDVSMEGVLYKWTNYLSGWQSRWFVLDGGILSYYEYQEDVGKGCKGSIKMSVCEIQVNPADCTRMDLIIPGEQCFYVRATSALQRQRWLVALGSAKACLHDSRTKKEKEISETSDCLKNKMSELRLYSNLIGKQIGLMHVGLQHAESDSEPHMQRFREASSVLDSTCGNFLKSLEECMALANSTFKPELFQLSPPSSPVSPVSPISAPCLNNKVRRLQQPNSSSSERARMNEQQVDAGKRQSQGPQTVVRDLMGMAIVHSQDSCLWDEDGAHGPMQQNGAQEAYLFAHEEQMHLSSKVGRTMKETPNRTRTPNLATTAVYEG